MFLVRSLVLVLFMRIVDAQCPAGQEPDGAGCSACADGFYKGQSGATSCAECPINTDTNGQRGSSECMCAPGTEGDGTTCRWCVLSYQPGGVPNNVTCTPCPPNTVAPSGAELQSECVAVTSSEGTLIRGEMVLTNVQCTDSLRDSSSIEYSTFANVFTRQILSVFTTSDGILNIELSCGPVLVEYDLLFEGDPPAISALKSQLQESLDNTGGFIGIYQVDRESIDFGSDNSWVIITIGSICSVITLGILIFVMYSVRPARIGGTTYLGRPQTGTDYGMGTGYGYGRTTIDRSRGYGLSSAGARGLSSAGKKTDLGLPSRIYLSERSGYISKRDTLYSTPRSKYNNFSSI